MISGGTASRRDDAASRAGSRSTSQRRGARCARWDLPAFRPFHIGDIEHGSVRFILCAEVVRFGLRGQERVVAEAETPSKHQGGRRPSRPCASIDPGSSALRRQRWAGKILSGAPIFSMCCRPFHYKPPGYQLPHSYQRTPNDGAACAPGAGRACRGQMGARHDQGRTISKRAATSSSRSSEFMGPMICSPAGIRPGGTGAGTTIAGRPARLIAVEKIAPARGPAGWGAITEG